MAKAIIPEIGSEVNYLSVDYVVTKVTETGVSLKRKNSKSFDTETVVNKGSTRYCNIFGGEPVSIDGSIADSVLTLPQTKSILSAYKTIDENEMFGSGPIVQLVDAITEEEGKPNKIKLLQEAIMDFELPHFIGILLMSYVYINRKALVATEAERIKALFSKLKACEEYDSSVIELVENIQNIDTVTDKQIIDIFNCIPAEDRAFFAHAISGWQDMDTIGIPNKDVLNIADKAIEEYNNLIEEDEE